MGFRTGGGGGSGAGGGRTGLTEALGAGRTGFRDADGPDGLAEREGRWVAGARFFGGLRLEEVRAFTARRNFAMPGG